jgi:hypothetical protein
VVAVWGRRLHDGVRSAHLRVAPFEPHVETPSPPTLLHAVGDDCRCWVPEAGQRLRRLGTRRCRGRDRSISSHRRV